MSVIYELAKKQETQKKGYLNEIYKCVMYDSTNM